MVSRIAGTAARGVSSGVLNLTSFTSASSRIMDRHDGAQPPHASSPKARLTWLPGGIGINLPVTDGGEDRFAFGEGLSSLV